MTQHIQVHEKIPFNVGKLSRPPQALVEYVSTLHAKERERRASHRLPGVIPVVVMPLDESLHSTGAAFTAVTGDLSTTGARLFSTQAPESQFLAINLASPAHQSIQVVVKVLRCKIVGQFHEIAGQFIARTDN